ncbi:MAG TPA: hypothetical protein ENJ13_09130 [Chromatiales bacterium]|nr:hypothetical protein [Chromatiales bacterium]
MSENERTTNEKLVHAYNTMMERVKQAIDEAGGEAGPKVSELVARAEKKAVELGELTAEEAIKIGDYLKRDLDAAADYLASEETQELIDWLKFDIELIEERILEAFLSVADQTKVELLALEERAAHADEYHTGEITGPGTLVCVACDEHIHFHRTGHIPPCPKCHATVYRRSQSK